MIHTSRRVTLRARMRWVGSVVAVCCSVLLALTACTADVVAEQPSTPTISPNESESRPLVLTTFSVLADIAQNVAGEHLRVESLTKPGTEIHGYEPTPGDLRRAADATLIIDNGMNLEAWFAQFIDEVDAPHVVVSEGVEVIDIRGDDLTGLPNPHAWMSALNVQVYVDNLAAAFGELDPQHAEAYASNAADYSAQLQAVHDELLEELDSVPERQRALVTCEGAFSYLARDANLAEAFVWAVNAEQQATPRKIASVIDFVRENEVPAVFCESTVSDASMQRVVEATDANFGGILYVDSLSEPGGPVPTYIDLLRHNGAVIAAGLTGETR
jgi:manganese transport system substrate-binding protein